ISLAELPEVAPAPRLLRQALVVGADRAAVAQRAEVLARVEAERGGGAEGAGAAVAVAGAVGLGRVLEHEEAVALRDRADRVHVSHLTVQVDREDGRRPRADSARGGVRVDQPG